MKQWEWGEEIRKNPFSFHCCVPTTVSPLKPKTLCVAVSSPVFHGLLLKKTTLKPQFCAPEGVKICLGLSPRCCCRHRCVVTGEGVSTLCTFTGSRSLSADQMGVLTLVCKGVYLSSVYLSGLLFIKNQGTTRAELWQIGWLFINTPSSVIFTILTSMWLFFLLSASKIEVVFNS